MTYDVLLHHPDVGIVHAGSFESKRIVTAIVHRAERKETVTAAAVGRRDGQVVGDD